MRAIIVDNEAHVIRGLQLFLKGLNVSVEVIDTAVSVKEAIAAINRNKFDLLFLDIELDDGTGFDILKSVYNRDYDVVFVTAYDNYALQAFQMSATDYLLKPIDPDDLQLACLKVQSRLDREVQDVQTTSLNVLLENLAQSAHQEHRIVIHDNSKIHSIRLADICYLQADGAYTSFVMENSAVISSKNLKSYEEVLLSKHFYRSHHSSIVNLMWISHFDKQENSLLLKNGIVLPVSHRKRNGLIQEINNLSI